MTTSTASTSASPKSRNFLGLSQSQWIVVAMIGGILVGWKYPTIAVQLKPFSNIFLSMIKLLIVPLLASTLIVGIAGHGDDMKKVGKLAFRSIVYFEIVTTLALVIGLVFVNYFKPGVGVHLTPGASVDEFTALSRNAPTWGSVLEHTVPSSFFKAAADNEV
ncbi:MAG: cation:dicarboxylase symporter family transporter, partial [Gemmatimonadaceae bacterium]